MENNMEHYLLLLTAEEQKFLKLYLQNPAMTNKTLLRNKPFRLLEEKPYPILDILLLQPPNVMVHIKWAIIRTFEEMLRLVAKTGINVAFLQFLIKIPDDILNEALQGEMREQFQQCLSETNLGENLYLALLSRKDKQLMVDILEYLKDTRWQFFQQPLGSKEFVLYHALKSKAHFMNPLIEELQAFESIEDPTLRNNLIILKLVHEFSSKAFKSLNELAPNMESLLELMDFEHVDADLLPIYTYFYQDFERLILLMRYIGKFPETYSNIEVEDLLNTNSILEVITKHRLMSSYEEIRDLVESYYACQQNLPMFSFKEKELELLCCYYILATTYDIVTAPASIANTDGFYNQKIQTLSGLLRQIKNFDLLCQTLEDVMTFIFLRWEHFHQDSKGIKYRKLNYSDSSSHTDDDIVQDSSAKSSNTPQKNKSKILGNKNGKFGFVCRPKSFASLFNFLKTYVTKKLHSPDYKMASSEMRNRFQSIVDTIGDFLWKFTFFEKMERKQTECASIIHLNPDALVNMVHFHADSDERISSDDEGTTTHHYSMARRKAVKKRRRATFSGAVGRDKNLLESRARASVLSSSMKVPSKSQKNEIPIDIMEEKSVVPKLLSSPERLACLALSFKEIHETKQIIENFNLHNSQLNLELEYMEQQQRVKQKLSVIYDNYQQQERDSLDSNEPVATVDRIRSVAAKGFEVSKIINIIDNFAQTQSIKQTELVKELIRKHKQNPQYRFLSQFEEANLKAAVICDLILCLPFNRDITNSILMIIKRLQPIHPNFKDSENVVEKCQFPSNMGPLNFLENIADCMAILRNKSIRDILCDNCYSLRPQKLAVELAKEKIFFEVFHKDPKELKRCEDLKTLINKFQALKSKYNYYQRFCNYMQHLSTLEKLRNPKRDQCIEDLLKLDPYDIIGDLIFSRNMTPLEIEANVTALNLNLVHIIALNMCPEIVERSSLSKRSITCSKESTILNYIANYNRLLVFLLQGINDGVNFPKDPNINAGYLERLVQLPEVNELASLLYNGNKVIAALRSDQVNINSLEKLTSKLDQLKLLELDLGIKELRSIKQSRIDCLIAELIREDPKYIYLASRVHNITVRAKLIHANYTKISSTRLAKQLIETTLQHRHAAERIPKELLQQLEVILADIRVYAQVSEVLLFESWPQAYDFGLKTPATIFEHLLKLNLYKLCYEWCKVVKLSEKFKPQQFLSILLKYLMDVTDDDDKLSSKEEESIQSSKYLLRILETFHPVDCKSFLDSNKDKFRSLILIKFAIEYLERSASVEEKYNYRNYKISLLIFDQLAPTMRNIFWTLLKYPLLIIEELIMNAKFESLSKVLKVVRQELQSDTYGSHKLCSFCFDKNGNAYDIHGHHHAPNSPHKVRFQLGSHDSTKTSAFILLNFNLYQKEHFITNDCIDLLLRIYATKALDYQISDTNSSSEPCSQSTCDMQQSLDSLCGAFQMPSQAPTREEWIRDEDASHCMCCRRTAFSMLMRRHHCRRCGRVVCFSCSTHRMRIPELYEDVEVRVCNDCQNLCEDINQRKANRDSQAEDVVNATKVRLKPEERFKWKLSGNITHDKLLREEFCYEHAPSVALCLSILEYHLGKKKCVDLLLFHCRKLEKLMVPNPEVDYELVAKMMNCLALAAKVRGASAEFETIQEDSEIIISVVQNGCEYLIPPDPLNNLWKLAESLVEAEKWELALEVHLKCGLSTAGVMAAHGMSCLRAGCFETAREKFSHCMTKLTNENIISTISKIIFNPVINAYNDNLDNVLGLSKDCDIKVIKRPHNGPPLLQEILKLIESMPFTKPQPETLQRASIIRSSNTSLASLLSRKKEQYVKRSHEPAINILNTLSNLKRISKGQYTQGTNTNNNSIGNQEMPIKRKQLFRKTSGFEECLYYLLTYGSHTDVIHFLMNRDELVATLKYYLLQKLDADIFINHIYLVLLSRGKVSLLIKNLLEFDSRLLIWRSTLLQTCRYLETQNLLNSLYELQILLKDPIRACMTCIKFYSMNCENFQQLNLNAQHLRNARMHLQSELDNAEWEKITLNVTTKSNKGNNNSRRSSTSSTTGSMGGGNFFLQMDARSLNSHITTIENQLEVVKFLAKCEEENSRGNDIVITEKYLKQLRIDAVKTLPTLFDKGPEKIQICILILVCGKNIEEGFGLSYRIIQHYKLPPLKVYAATAKYLALNQRLPEIEKLLNCIISNNGGTSTQDIDEILTVAINSAVNNHEPETKATLDNLTKRINNIDMRIAAHIFIGQLKSAYLLANKYERLGDIRKILRQAEATNQVHIKKLCEKKLQLNLSGTSSSQSK
ncbi:zinc finger FYVE-type containing 26 spastizin [Haematobia irritans]|uniref:zinc finger FYVE-type containing 26 spastizin n=1 Tax=Haematobia irritans TaxID=7368 RepID=UPI003F4F4CBA